MSLGSTSQYNVQIDSNYRDISKYPTFTDFSVKFKNNNTSTFLNGYPIDNKFNIPSQIDPDFINADFSIVNGSLQHLQIDSSGNYYISGTINTLSNGNVFQILEGNYTVYTLQTNNIPNVFICKIIPINKSYSYLSWICYLTEPTTTTNISYRLDSTRSTFDIDISGNIYWEFDCSFNTVDVYSSINGYMYTISPQNSTNRQYSVLCAFTSDGYQYTLNGIPWGYHIISSNNDILPTLESGRNYIKSNTSLDLFTTINTNPYDPYVYSSTGILGSSTNTVQNSYLFMLNTGSSYYDTNPRYLYFRNNSSGASIGFEYYKVSSTSGYQYISTFDNIGLPLNSSWWNLSFNYTQNYIYIVMSQTIGKMWLVTFNLINQTMMLKYNQSLFPLVDNSQLNTTYNSTNSLIYITTDALVYGSPGNGTLLYSLNPSNPTGSGGANLIYADTDVAGSNHGMTYDIIKYNNYIVSGFQGNIIATGEICFGLYVYNISSGTHSSIHLKNIGNYSITTFNIASPTFFIDLNNNLNCCLTCIDKSIIFSINPSTLQVTYLSQVNNLSGNQTTSLTTTKSLYFSNNNKSYLIGSSNGAIYDISVISYPYQITTSYPSIKDGYNMVIYNIINTPICNYLSGLFNPNSKDNRNMLFTTNFIDTQTTISSTHYSKPIVTFEPSIDISGYSKTNKEIFSIPGTSVNNTTFSPSQFINNGLIAWYKCTDVNNLVTYDTNVVGIRDISGNGLDLYADNTDTYTCPVFNNGLFWDCYNTNQTSSFTSKKAWTSSTVKFIIATYQNPNYLTSNNVYIIQCYSGSNVYAQLSPTGVGMGYTDGVYYTYADTKIYETILSNSNNATYFGYNTTGSLQPYLNYQYANIEYQDLNLTPVTSSTNYINIMSGLTQASYSAFLYEIIMLDFIPTEYQLSLFQSYLNSSVYIYPQVTSQLSGVFTVYNSPNMYSYNSTTNLMISSIDGSIAPYNVLSPLYIPPGNYDYNQVRHIRNQESKKPNHFCTVCNDNYVRIFRVDDYISSSYNYSEIDLSTFNYPIFHIEPYIDSNNVTRIIVATRENTSTTTGISAILINLKLIENNTDSYDTITITSSYAIPIGAGVPSAYTINSFKVHTYNDGKIYLFVIASLNDILNGSITYPIFLVYDITNPLSFTKIYSIPLIVEKLPDEKIVNATNINSTKIIEYSNGKVYFVYKRYFGGANNIYDITDPLNIIIVGEVKSGNITYLGYTENPVNRNTAYYANPVDMYVNPITNNVYFLDSFSLNGTGSVSFYNYTDINSISSEYLIPQVYYNPLMNQLYDISSSIITNIKTVIWNQKVWAMFNFCDSNYTNQGTVFFDFSNIEYVSQNYTNNINSSIIKQQTYTNINGIGIGVIHKITNDGYPNWLSTIGGDGSSYNNKWSSDINISNIDLDNTLTYAYISGSWKYKIQTFVNADFNGNPIAQYQLNNITSTVSDNGINSYLCKININNGTFVWMIPTLGNNADYIQRIMFNPSNSTISVVAYSSSSVMLVYQAQQSALSGWTNPINTILNVSNTSATTSSLITFDTSGNLKWSAKLYSTEQISQTKLFDVYIDSGYVTCIGLTNANKLSCIDSTLLNVQDTYTNIDPLTQECVVLYTFNSNGVYQKSQRVELSPDALVSVFDLKTYSSLNRIIYFVNYFTYKNNGNIYMFNKDGSLANTLTTYPINSNFSKVIQYQFDSSFTDTNGKKYSNIVLQGYTYSGPSLNNYKLFIQGSVLSVPLTSVFTTSLNTETVLNSNFSIRSNSLDSKNNTIITLNSLINTSQTIRANLPENNSWSSSISSTPLNGIVSLNTTYYSNTYNIAQLFCSSPTTVSTTGTYYLLYPNTSGGITSLEISSITLYRGMYTITTTQPMSDNSFFPYAQLSTVNNNVNYTLQFYPGSIAVPLYFKVALNTLTLPNRPVKSYNYSGVRYLTDFPYIYLTVVNTDDNENVDPSILNDYYSNNINRNKTAIFTLSTTSLGGGSNFSVISGSSTSKVKFSPGYNNIHVTLYDPDGNVIIYDNTAVLASDSLFKGGTVPDSLMRIALSLTFSSV